MKKLSAVLLLLLLLVLTFSTLADEDAASFKPAITNSLDISASKWFSNEEYRAALTILLSIEYAQENPDFDPSSIITGSSYVGYQKDNRALFVIILSESNEVHTLMYSPSAETVFYDSLEDTNDLVIELVLKDQCDDYYRNSKSDISDVVELLQEVLE